jgi:hypothetical protein
MAHQYIAQIGGAQKSAKSDKPSIKDAVFGNVGTMMSFKVGAEDAEYLEKEYAPTLSQQDIIGIANFTTYCKLNIDNASTRPFDIKTIWDNFYRNERAASIIKEYSRKMYAERNSTSIWKSRLVSVSTRKRLQLKHLRQTQIHHNKIHLSMSHLLRYTKIFLFFAGIVGCLWASADLPGLRQIYEGDKYYNYNGGMTNGTGIRNVLIQIFKSLAIVVFILAVIIAFISVIRLLTSGNSEEDFGTWWATLVWSLAGLFLISIAYTVIRQFETRVFSEQTINAETVYDTVINIIYPILNFLRYIAATVFFLTAIWAFYRIVTSAGNEEGFDAGKKIFIGSIIGFVIMMIAEPLVRIAYGGGSCGGNKIFGVSTDCTNRVFDASGVLGTIAKIIVFLNGFIALVVIIMIIYAGFLVLTGAGDEEKNDKAKKTITYAIIGVVILIFSYVIYRFMILQS